MANHPQNPAVLPPGARRMEGSEGYWTTDPLGGGDGAGMGRPTAGGGGGSAAPRPTPRAGMSLQQLSLIKSQLGPASGPAPLAPAPVYGGPNLTAAHSLAFGRAKDRAGKVGRASLTGLRENLAGRGLLGSGIEGAGTAEISGDIAGDLSDIITKQAGEEVGAASEAARMNFDAQQQHASRTDAAQRDAASRQQEMSQSLLGLIRSAGGLYDQSVPDPDAPEEDSSYSGRGGGNPYAFPGGQPAPMRRY